MPVITEKTAKARARAPRPRIGTYILNDNTRAPSDRGQQWSGGRQNRWHRGRSSLRGKGSRGGHHFAQAVDEAIEGVATARVSEVGQQFQGETHEGRPRQTVFGGDIHHRRMTDQG